MRKVFLVVAGLSVFGAADAVAQGLASPVCPPGAPLTQAQAAQDACQQAYDVFQFLAPQLATAIAGGNATIGSGSTLGGIGHFSVGVRINAVQGAYPDVANYSPTFTGAQRRPLPTKDQLLPFPTADAAIGLLGGIPLGVTNVLAVDALVSATYVPSFNANSLNVTPTQSLQIGYGARIGILQESIVVPGLSVTILKRDLPTTTLTGTSQGASIRVSNLSVDATSWRVVASKNLVVLGFAVGAGQDKFSSSGDISAVATNVPIVGTAQSTVPGTNQDLTRTNFFADVALNLPLFKIVAEAGLASGGSVATYNSFTGGAADRSLTYYSLGLRFGF